MVVFLVFVIFITRFFTNLYSFEYDPHLFIPSLLSGVSLVLIYLLAQKLFEALGLEHYAHQEKDRVSFTLKDWNFDLDKYPGMPAYLEIEGKNHAHVQDAIKLLNLEEHRSIGEGERLLIEKEYGLNWCDMRFKTEK